MAFLVVPAGLKFRRTVIDFDQPAQVNRSAYSSSRRVMGLPGGSLWSGSTEIVVKDNTLDPLRARAFLANLEGQVHSFGLPYAKNQHSHVATAAVGAGAASGSFTLPVQGMGANVTYLFAGQYMTVSLPSGARQLVILTQHLVASAGGTGTAYFLPMLREAPIQGAAIETRNPYCQVSNMSSKVSWTNEPGGMFQFAPIDVEEAY